MFISFYLFLSIFHSLNIRILIHPLAICIYCVRILFVKCSIKEFPLLTLWVIMSPGTQYNFIPWLICARLSHHFTSTFQFSISVSFGTRALQYALTLIELFDMHALHDELKTFEVCFVLSTDGLIGLLHTILE